jgi:rhodanese-related sulfurtransferase
MGNDSLRETPSSILEVFQQMQYIGNPADEILPGYWLGNAVAARDEVFLKEKGIRAVFNCSKEIPFRTTHLMNYRIPVDDNLQADEIRNLELWAFEIVYKVRKEHTQGPVLVHCAAGMQRSAAVTAMYLIALTGQKWEDVKAYIRGKRPIAFQPAANFEKAILGFEAAFDKEVRPRLGTGSNTPLQSNAQ